MPEVTLITVLAVLAGVLQATGYLTYLVKSLRREIDPNPTTWLMFAYGTAFLAFLEWDRNATWPVLLLPVVCATLSIVVAALCYFRGEMHWPKDPLSRFAFRVDVILTAAYLFTGYFASGGALPEVEREKLVLTFLILTNISTAVSFLPLLKGAWNKPLEHSLPWTIWASAYGILGFATLLEERGINELMIYPVTCFVLHGLVAIFAARKHLASVQQAPSIPN